MTALYHDFASMRIYAVAFAWTVSSAIEFTSNGVKVMGDLSKASKALGDSLKVLQATVDGVVASLDLLSVSGIRATDVLVDLNAATGKSNASTTRSTARVTRAATAYDAMAVSAARAAAGVRAVSTASIGGRSGLPRGGGSAGGIGGFMSMLPGPLGVASRVGGIANRLTGGGLGHLAEGGMLVDAVFEASKLQQILLSVKNETGASNSQIAKFSNTAYSIGAQNGMSVNEAGEILRTISRLTAGQFSTDKMMQVAPMVAKYASLVHFNRPDISVEEAAKTGIQTAHLFRAYQPKALDPLLDKVYRLSGMMAEKPEAALRQMSYYVPLFKALNVSDESSIGTMALLDRGGFRNKVGTNVRALVLEALGPQQLTSFAQKGKAGILEQMGLFKNGKFAWNNKDGSLNFFGELSTIGNWAQAQRKNHVPDTKIASEMYGALGKQGGTVGSLFLDPQMAPILDGIRKYLKDPNVGIAAAGKNRDSGFGYQFTATGKDFQSLMTDLGGVALPGMTKAFKDLGDSLHGAQVWLHQHKEIEKQWSDDMMSTVRYAESFLVAHKADFIAIGNNLASVGSVLGMIARTASIALGPLTRVLRIVTDIATLHWNDLPAAFGAKPGVSKDYVNNMLGGGPLPLGGQVPNGAPGSNRKSPGGPTMPIPAWFHAPPLTIQVDARGSSDPKAVHAAALAGARAGVQTARAALNRGGAHHTGFGLPNPVTVDLGHGAH